MENKKLTQFLKGEIGIYYSSTVWIIQETKFSRLLNIPVSQVSRFNGWFFRMEEDKLIQEKQVPLNFKLKYYHVDNLSKYKN